MAKSWRLELGDNILQALQVYLQPLWRNWPAKQSKSAKNAKEGLLRSSRSFKVIEVGINRKPVCDFLLVINSNWHPLVPFGSYPSLLFKFWTLHFWASLGGAGTTYHVHLGLIEKRVVDFLLVLIELFSLCYGSTGENRSKIADFAPRPVWLKISDKRHPHKSFLHG